MARDIISELTASLDDAIGLIFARNLRQDAFILDFLEKTQQDGAGGLKLQDVQKYSEHLGEAAAKTLRELFNPQSLTDNESERKALAEYLLKPLLKRDFRMIQKAANQVQKALDETDGIGLNGVNAEFPEDRASGLVDKLTGSKSIEEAHGYLGEPIVNFHEHSYDRWVQVNAEFRERSGMESKIVRTAHSGACAWCRALAKVYDYGRDVIEKGNTDVFRRHKYCRCTVVFESGKMRQNVWSKRTWQASPAELAARKLTGRTVTVLSPEIAEEFNALAERDRMVDKEIKEYKKWQEEHPDARRAYRNIDRRMARDRVNRSLKRAEEDAKIAPTIAGKLLRDPSVLGQMSPKEIKEALEKAGFDVKPLGSGRLKGVSFEDGGGFKVNFGGTGLIQYHPEKYSHHGGAYYKISTGERGLHRYGTDGTEQPDRPKKPKN